MTEQRKLVPVTPTPEMVDALWDALPKGFSFQNCTPIGVIASIINAAPTRAQGSDEPLGWVWERCYSNGGYTRKFCALESEARELATDGEALSHPDQVYPFFGRAHGADDAQPVAITEAMAEEMGAGDSPHSEPERLLFEAYSKGHCWAVGEWNGRYYVDMSDRILFAYWRDRAALAARDTATRAQAPDSAA